MNSLVMTMTMTMMIMGGVIAGNSPVNVATLLPEWAHPPPGQTRHHWDWRKVVEYGINSSKTEKQTSRAEIT